MMIDISNKVIVITGGARGIGREMVKRFASENAKVIINYFKSEKEAKQLFDEIIQFNLNCILVKADVTDIVQVKKLYEETIKHFGRVDILINNAGICEDMSLQNMNFEQWMDVINVNINGVFNCTKVFLKKMIEYKSGKIINIGSYKGITGSEKQSNYSASKSAIIGFTKSLAKEVGKYNIAVNTVCPGFIQTNLNKDNMEKQMIAEEKSIMNIENNLEDIVDFVCYLSSDHIRSVSGQVFHIDSRIV